MEKLKKPLFFLFLALSISLSLNAQETLWEWLTSDLNAQEQAEWNQVRKVVRELGGWILNGTPK